MTVLVRDAQHSAPVSVPVAGRRLRLAVISVSLLAFGMAALGAPIRSSYYALTTGDEPHYLLTALSLAQDRSLDLSDEQADERYRPFHEIRLQPQGKVLAGGRIVAPHDPGLPALLAVPMKLGGWMAARLTLAVLAGILAGLVLWCAVRRFGASLPAATLSSAVFGASAPLAVYGSQVYPEIPAALALTIVVAVLTGRLRPAGLVGFVAGIVGLVWLGTKFIPVATVVAIIGLRKLWKGSRKTELRWVTGAFALCAVAYVAAHLAWYQGLTVYAVGAHFAETGEFSVVGVNPNFPARSVRLVGLLADAKFGLAAWQPAWLLALPAAGALHRRRPANWPLLLAPLAAGWLNATFVALTMHGWWWPGRQVVVVLPLAALAVAVWATGSGRRLALAGALGAIGIFNLAWLFAQGWQRRLTMVVDFFNTSNPIYRSIARVLPDYQAMSGSTLVLHMVWLVVCAGLLAFGAGWLKPAAKRP
ncbi:MAG: hypothetical protein ACT4OM_07490 [Actinomycetota bacterium]